jgi:hypothetical protein
MKIQCRVLALNKVVLVQFSPVKGTMCLLSRAYMFTTFASPSIWQLESESCQTVHSQLNNYSVILIVKRKASDQCQQHNHYKNDSRMPWLQRKHTHSQREVHDSKIFSSNYCFASLSIASVPNTRLCMNTLPLVHISIDSSDYKLLNLTMCI